jgi:cytochrome c556
MRLHIRTYAVTVMASLVCALMSVSPARADDPSAAQKAVEIRQSVLKLVGWNFSPTIGPMMANKMKFDAAVVQKDAARLEALAPMIPDAFALDTHEIPGLQTRARADIWTHMADFKAKGDDLVKAVTALAAVAKNGDEGAFRQAARVVSDACRVCHDSYRND